MKPEKMSADPDPIEHRAEMRTPEPVTARSIPQIFRSPEVEAILYDEGKVFGKEYRLANKRYGQGALLTYFAPRELEPKDE